jgi:hypothetical protein
MDIPLDLVDRYARTFFDFWRLRPRQFLSARGSVPDAYLSAYQFLVISLGLTFGMMVIALTLSFAAVQGADPTSASSDPKAIAGQTIVLLIMLLGVNSLILCLAARLPPVRRRPSLPAVFEFNCYTLSIALPMYAITFLVLPMLAGLVAQGLVPSWSVFILMGFSYLVGMISFFVYTLPGIACISGVSTGRMVAGFAVLSLLFFVTCALLGFTGGFMWGYLHAS